MNFPFKVKPQQDFVNIGSEKSGIIEVVAYNDLTIAEQLEYDEAIAQLGNETKPLVDLIIKVSKEKQLSFEKAQAVIFGNGEIELPNGKDAAAIRLEYSEALMALNAQILPIQKEKQIIGATIIIKRTLEPINAFLEESKKKLASAKDSEKEAIESTIAEYEQRIIAVKNWTVEDTKKCDVLRQSTLKVLYEFFLKESNGGVLPEIEEVAEDTIAEKPTKTIEEMGKPVVVNVEATQEESSGEKSSGESKTTGRATLASPPKNSRVAPVP